MSFFLILSETHMFELDADVFQQELLRHWAATDVNRNISENNTVIVSWMITSNAQTLIGSYFENKFVSFDGDEQLIFEFSLWYRRLIQETIPLMLCHEEIPAMMINLTLATTKEDLHLQISHFLR